MAKAPPAACAEERRVLASLARRALPRKRAWSAAIRASASAESPEYLAEISSGVVTENSSAALSGFPRSASTSCTATAGGISIASAITSCP